MPAAKLTKRAVDILEAGDRPYVMYDTDLTGFGVRVMPSGFKSWVIEYRPGDGGRRVAKKRMTLGDATQSYRRAGSQESPRAPGCSAAWGLILRVSESETARRLPLKNSSNGISAKRLS